MKTELPRNRPCYSSKVTAYLAKRGITAETAAAFGVGQDAQGNMVFPYYRTRQECEAKASVFNKFRKPQKLEKGDRKMWRESDTEPIMFGMHLCDDSPMLYIFEGEFDALCGYQVSDGLNCVSVPSGCEDFTWLETCRDWLQQFSIIAVIADNDEPGRRMLRELSLKLECEVMQPDFEAYRGCKDANEILARYGAEQLRHVMTSVRPVPVQGLLNLADVERVNLDELPRVLSGVPALDKATGGLYMDDLSIWTGKRGEGKSTILTQILLESIEQGQRVCAYSGEIPADRFKYVVNLQAAGEYIEKRTDNLTGRDIHFVARENLDQIERWYNGKFWLYDNAIIEGDEAESILRVFELAYRRYDCKVFLCDNLMTVSACRNERDYYQMQADFTIKLSKLAKRLGVHVHLVVHPRKGGINDNDSVAGLSTLTNVADNVFSMRRVSEDEHNELNCAATLTCLKNRVYGELNAIKLDYDTGDRRFTECSHAMKNYGWMQDGFVTMPESNDYPF